MLWTHVCSMLTDSDHVTVCVHAIAFASLVKIVRLSKVHGADMSLRICIFKDSLLRDV